MPTEDAESLPPGLDLYLRLDNGQYDFRMPERLRPSAYYAVDTHLNMERMIPLASQFDAVFSAQKDGVAGFAESGIEASWLPLACWPEFHSAPANTPKMLDLAYVGNVRLRWWRRHKLKPRDRFLYAVRRRFKNSHIGQARAEDLGRVYGSARVGLNRTIRNDICMRFFEVMCSGTMLLTNRTEGNGFLEFFSPGENLAVYESDDEVFDAIDYWLAHEDERERIAAAGKELVLGKHTYAHRAENMLRILRRRLNMGRR